MHVCLLVLLRAATANLPAYSLAYAKCSVRAVTVCNLQLPHHVHGALAEVQGHRDLVLAQIVVLQGGWHSTAQHVADGRMARGAARVDQPSMF